MKFIFSVLLICTTLQGFSQLKTIDSLQQLLDNTPREAIDEQMDLNLKLASKYNSIKNRKSIIYAQKAYDLAVVNDSLNRQHEALISIANYKKNYEVSDTVVTILDQVKAYANTTKKSNLYLRANNALIGFYMITRDDVNALTIAQENLDLATTDEEKFYANFCMVSS